LAWAIASAKNPFQAIFLPIMSISALSITGSDEQLSLLISLSSQIMLHQQFLGFGGCLHGFVLIIRSGESQEFCDLIDDILNQHYLSRIDDWLIRYCEVTRQD
jgi:hypothetical protein